MTRVASVLGGGRGVEVEEEVVEVEVEEVVVEECWRSMRSMWL
jgi:hypothetical protein